MPIASEALVRLSLPEPSTGSPSPSPPRPTYHSRGRPVFVALSPSDPVLTVGGMVTLQARLVFSDLSGLDVTEDAVWTSSAPEVASVETNAGRRGRLTASLPGVAMVGASAGGKVGWTTVTVLGVRATQDSR